MKLFPCLISIIIGFLLAGCSKNTRAYGDGKVISVDFDKREQLSFCDIFSRIEIIELEGSKQSYLTDPVSLQVNHDNFYLKDQHAIIAFDKNGKFLFSTAKRRGRARNEYFTINDYFVIDNNIYILDYDSKILVYDEELNVKAIHHIHSKNNENYIAFALINTDLIALTGIGNDWLFYSLSKKQIIGTDKINNIKTGGFAFGQSRKLISNDSLTLFRIPDNGNSYCYIDPYKCSVTELFHYDFGRQTFNPATVDKNKTIKSFLLEHTREYVIAMETQINNKFILTRLGYLEELEDPRDGSFGISFYSLKTGETMLVNNIFNNGKWISNLDFMDDKCIYSCITDYSNIHELIDEKLLDSESKQIIQNLNNDTNCLIIK